MRLAVLASGRGSNLQAIMQSISRGRLAARVALVLSNVPDAPALGLAEAAGVPVWAKDHRKFSSRARFDAGMLEAMAAARVDAVALAGYMRLLSPAFLNAYPGRVLNVHPSLLPAFTGADGAGDTLAYGAKFAGCSVHIVEEAVDAGPVIIQAAVAVRDNETKESLMPRIHALEHRIYPQALHWLATGKLRLRGRVVHLPPAEYGEMSPHSAPSMPLPDGCLVNPPLDPGF
ncbi:phosphoribosylglycinamide formyltransferase [Desulfovibrio sp. OttesenSCG-928-I05]|nr:phosphoribosylglycinamide formyltransferase [Desulfovibrio sp. OttesenSCG-928-I05]